MKIVIIGGNAAGMSAASKARRNNKSAQIIVFEKSGTVSYGACGLPYFISDDIKDANQLLAVSVDEFREQRNIDVRLFHEALSFDPRKKVVYLTDSNKNEQLQQTYDQLIICTGASSVRPAIPGIDLKQVFFLRSLADGKIIKSFIDKENPKHAVVIGAGYIGLEMAEALKKRGMDVTVIEAVDQVMPILDPDMADLVQTMLETKQVWVLKNLMVAGISGDGKAQKIHLSDGRELPVDLVLVSAGIHPNVEFAKSGGVQLGTSGAIKVDAHLRTNLRSVYAAGDCAESVCRVVNKTTHVPLGTTANKQGRVAGDNASGVLSKFNGNTTTSVVKIFDSEVASTGLSSALAERFQIPYSTVQIKAGSRAHYYPGSKEIHVKLIFNNQNGRLLGSQIVGGEGVAKRIDILATALYNKMTVAQVAELDLSYSPPFAPVWDAVLIAANQAVKKVRN